MRPSLVIVSLLLCAACGGTASETPWPKEPEDINLGPAGEAERDRALTDKSRAPKADGEPSAPPSSAPPSSPKVDPVAP